MASQEWAKIHESYFIQERGFYINNKGVLAPFANVIGDILSHNLWIVANYQT